MDRWPDGQMSKQVGSQNSMSRPGTSKVLALETRHPGLVEKVNAMFDHFATIKAVEAMIKADYGEHIGHSTICNYRKRIWMVQRDRMLAIRAKRTARQELVSEGRN
jgi:hypothetical protein